MASFFRQRKGRPVSVLALVRLAPCRYRQVVSELRAKGLDIRCELSYTKAGKRSTYTYLGEA